MAAGIVKLRRLGVHDWPREDPCPRKVTNGATAMPEAVGMSSLGLGLPEPSEKFVRIQVGKARFTLLLTTE
jgi:hypothetical protein